MFRPEWVWGEERADVLTEARPSVLKSAPPAVHCGPVDRWLSNGGLGVIRLRCGRSQRLRDSIHPMTVTGGMSQKRQGIPFVLTGSFNRGAGAEKWRLLVVGVGGILLT